MYVKLAFSTFVISDLTMGKEGRGPQTLKLSVALFLSLSGSVDIWLLSIAQDLSIAGYCLYLGLINSRHEFLQSSWLPSHMVSREIFLGTEASSQAYVYSVGRSFCCGCGSCKLCDQMSAGPVSGGGRFSDSIPRC